MLINSLEEHISTINISYMIYIHMCDSKTQSIWGVWKVPLFNCLLGSNKYEAHIYIYNPNFPIDTIV